MTCSSFCEYVRVINASIMLFYGYSEGTEDQAESICHQPRTNVRV
jgi:hypothetical protein